MLMKRNLLYSVAMAVILVCGGNAAVAQTAYGIVEGASGYSTASVDMSTLSADETAIINTDGHSIDGVTSFYAGTSAGDKYYAFMCDEDNDTFFCTVNFETGNVVKINSSSYGWGSAGASMRDLTYDSTNGKLYGIENVVDDVLHKPIANIYEINPTTGAITKIAKLDSEYRGMAFDEENGGFYVAKYAPKGMSMLAQIFYISEANDYTPELILKNEEFEMPSTYNNTMVFNNGKLYFFTYYQVNEIDLEAKTITNLGNTGTQSGDKISNKELLGPTFIKSSVDGEAGRTENATNRLLVRSYTYGDYMGTVSYDVDMKKKEYFYDANYKLQRVINYSREYDDKNNPQDYVIEDMTKYNYDNDGLLENTVKYQRGVYDFGEIAFKEGATVTYEYDGRGRLTTEPNGYYLYSYEYDDNDNIVKVTKKNLSGATIQVITYSDFYDQNKPTAGVSTSETYPDTYNYYIHIDYDENGNKTREMWAKDEDFKQMKQLETWTYDGTFLKLYVKATSFDADGMPIPYSKTVYEMVDNDPNKVRYKDYNNTRTNGKNNWTGTGQPHMDEYVEFKKMNQQTRTNLTAEVVEGKINTVKLNISIPQIVYEAGDCDFAIYRDGDLITTKNIYDILVEDEDPEDRFAEPHLEFVDSLLYNGNHEYFVQPVIDESGIMPTDETGDNDDTEIARPTGTGYCISNIAEATVKLDLPAVTDLKAGNLRTDNNAKYVTISWTNPEYPGEYGFLRNDLYFTGFQLEEASTEDPTVSGLEGSFYDNVSDVFILSRFKYGKVISDTLTVNLETVGIEAVPTKSGTTISFDGRDVRLSRNAAIAVYSAAGKLEAKEADANGISLGNLNAGVYIVCLTKDGITTAHKVVVR